VALATGTGSDPLVVVFNSLLGLLLHANLIAIDHGMVKIRDTW
jgi:hypothetical protein